MSEWYWWFTLGIVVGWITKIPIFLHYYRDWEKEKLELWQMNKRILEAMKRGEL